MYELVDKIGLMPPEYLPVGIIAKHRSFQIGVMKEKDDDFRKDLFLKRLGRQIAKVRSMKGYSQDRVCLEAGLARGTLSKIENGLVDPKTSTLARAAETIGVPLQKLMDF